MRAMLTSLVALSLVTGLAGQADAASSANRKKKRLQGNHYAKPYRTTGRQPASNGSSDDYYEHLLDKAPFGSKRWWSIYDEQRGTPD